MSTPDSTPELTPEQSERKAVLYDLCAALPRNRVAGDLPDVLWIHFTDWYGFYDLERLVGAGLLELHPTLTYMPVGDWHDDFPPTAYSLTTKGRRILTHRSTWIFEGDEVTATP